MHVQYIHNILTGSYRYVRHQVTLGRLHKITKVMTGTAERSVRRALKIPATKSRSSLKT